MNVKQSIIKTKIQDFNQLCDKIFKENKLAFNRIDNSIIEILAHIANKVSSEKGKKEFEIWIDDPILKKGESNKGEENYFIFEVSIDSREETSNSISIDISYVLKKMRHGEISINSVKGLFRELGILFLSSPEDFDFFKDLKKFSSLIKTSLLDYVRDNHFLKLTDIIEENMEIVDLHLYEIYREIYNDFYLSYSLTKKQLTKAIDWDNDPFEINDLDLSLHTHFIFKRKDGKQFTKNNIYILKTFLFKQLPKIYKQLPNGNSKEVNKLYSSKPIEKLTIDFGEALDQKDRVKIKNAFHNTYDHYAEKEDISAEIIREFRNRLEPVEIEQKLQYSNIAIEKRETSPSTYHIEIAFSVFFQYRFTFSINYHLGHRYFTVSFQASQNKRGYNDIFERNFTKKDRTITKEEIDQFVSRVEKVMFDFEGSTERHISLRVPALRITYQNDSTKEEIVEHYNKGDPLKFNFSDEYKKQQLTGASATNLESDLVATEFWLYKYSGGKSFNKDIKKENMSLDARMTYGNYEFDIYSGDSRAGFTPIRIESVDPSLHTDLDDFRRNIDTLYFRITAEDKSSFDSNTIQNLSEKYRSIKEGESFYDIISHLQNSYKEIDSFTQYYDKFDQEIKDIYLNYDETKAVIETDDYTILLKKNESISLKQKSSNDMLIPKKRLKCLEVSDYKGSYTNIDSVVIILRNPEKFYEQIYLEADTNNPERTIINKNKIEELYISADYQRLKIKTPSDVKVIESNQDVPIFEKTGANYGKVNELPIIRFDPNKPPIDVNKNPKTKINIFKLETKHKSLHTIKLPILKRRIEELKGEKIDQKSKKTKKSQKQIPLTKLGGLGSTTEDKLNDMGINTIDDLIKADPDKVGTEVYGVTSKSVEDWIEEAKSLTSQQQEKKGDASDWKDYLILLDTRNTVGRNLSLDFRTKPKGRELSVEEIEFLEKLGEGRWSAKGLSNLSDLFEGEDVALINPDVTEPEEGEFSITLGYMGDNSNGLNTLKEFTMNKIERFYMGKDDNED